MMCGEFIFACILLALVLVWLWIQRRRLHALLKVFCVVCLVAPAICQDEDIIMGERPCVFPEPMMQAEAAIDDIFGNDSDHMMFLSDGYWPIWLNNSTIA